MIRWLFLSTRGDLSEREGDGGRLSGKTDCLQKSIECSNHGEEGWFMDINGKKELITVTKTINRNLH